ncbi:MAG: ribosome assembly cofactor RimP [Candidatus Cloacimonetes bacterium]|nr:ribosome assembly cofactor RimP [Candidatus Cloacimonadota bacterium]
MERIEKIAVEICKENNVALYDLQIKNTLKGKIVLIYITKINGVSIEDCRNVSRQIGYILDHEDIIPGKFFLEVSSPGLERELKLKKHYMSAINERATITFQDNDKTITKIGTIKEVQPETLSVEFADRTDSILFKNIKKAKTFFEFKKEKR